MTEMAGAQDTQEPARVDLTSASEGLPLWRQYLRAIGPGLVTGASDDDPSAIASYAAAGAGAGLGLLWTCIVAFPLMVGVQINADRTALATGRSLGELARERFGGFGRRVFVVLLSGHLLANALVIAADLIAVGSGMELLRAGPTWVWALLAGAAITGLVLSGSFAVLARVLKVMCLALVGYVAVLFVVDVDWPAVVRHTLVPHVQLNATYLGLMLAVLGATLPPYVFLWQNVHRLEDMRDEPEGGPQPLPLHRRPPWSATRKQRTSSLDVVCGMTFAVMVMFAVMVSSAVTIAADGPRRITSAAQAAQALEPVAGGAAKAIFAVAFIAAGILAIPVIAGAGSAGLAGYLGRSWGFSRSIRQAPVFYSLVAAGTVAGTVLSLVGIDPIQLLVTAATVNGLTSAPLLALVMVISGDRRLMGVHRAGRTSRVLGWAAVALMSVTAIAVVVGVIV